MAVAKVQLQLFNGCASVRVCECVYERVCVYVRVYVFESVFLSALENELKNVYDSTA